jgi:hypothetical protein
MRTTGIVTAALVSLGLIEQEGSRYRNSAAAETFLASQPGVDLRPLLRSQDNIGYPQWTKFLDVVRAGGGEAQFGKFDRVQQQLFSTGVEAFTAPVAAALGTTYDFSSHQRLLDVGGAIIGAKFILTISNIASKIIKAEIGSFRIDAVRVLAPARGDEPCRPSHQSQS